jgi:GNAT superfamily N-acetyltransferase
MNDPFADPGMQVVLRDGSRVRVRKGHHTDRELLLAGFEKLGSRSRYRRFLSAMPRLSESAIEYLLDIDHRDHEVLVAIDESNGEGVGVARFVRLADRPDTAEAAVTVIDDWQGRGVGTALLDLLADRAREEEIVRFTSLLLAENHDMLELLHSLGTSRIVDQQTGTIAVESELPPRGAGRDLHDVLRATARHWRDAAPPEPHG